MTVRETSIKTYYEIIDEKLVGKRQEEVLELLSEELKQMYEIV